MKILNCNNEVWSVMIQSPSHSVHFGHASSSST